jgi:FkbM family methyltransferase
MSVSPSPNPAHAASTEQAHFFRNPISRVVTEAVSLHEDSAERAGKYPASGIISYAQNREDILLWRALRDLPDGFYIDAGAQDPTQDSVTRAFYERGWHGINVEPVQGHFDKLCHERPRDLTLQVAIGNRVGWTTLYEFPDTGLSTLLEKVASRHQSKGFRYVERCVPMVTLTSLWEDFVKGEVHFLKIDVEGYESQVLSGMALARHRPWIILIEATEPLTCEESWHEWEGKILEARYEFVHFDGLNRWYLAAEKSELKERFEAPPNIFDQFELASTISLCHNLATVKHDLEQMRASASWRWTAPLRTARDLFCRLAERRNRVMEEWGDGVMEEWSDGGMEEWRNGGMEEWGNGGME